MSRTQLLYLAILDIVILASHTDSKLIPTEYKSKDAKSGLLSGRGGGQGGNLPPPP